MVERVDDLISFAAYMALPAELFLSIALYPRFFLAMPTVARVFGISVFGFSVCCGGVHFLRAVQRIDTVQMEVLSWGTAFFAVGTALFLLPNIRIFFRTIDHGLREQSHDNAILAATQRKEETFRACISHQLRNPLYVMEARIRSLMEVTLEQQPQQQESLAFQHPCNEANVRSYPSAASSYSNTLMELDSLRESILAVVNASLDPEVSTILSSLSGEQNDEEATQPTATAEPSSQLNVRRLIKQTIRIIQLEMEGEGKQRFRDRTLVINNNNNTKPQVVDDEEEDPLVVQSSTVISLMDDGEIDESMLPLPNTTGGAKLYGNVAHISQILYNLLSCAARHAVVATSCHDSAADNGVVVHLKYHVSLISYERAVKRGVVVTSNNYQQQQPYFRQSGAGNKDLEPVVLALRVDGMPNGKGSWDDSCRASSNFSLRVATELVERSGGTIRFEETDKTTEVKTNSDQPKKRTSSSAVAHVVVRMKSF